MARPWLIIGALMLALPAHAARVRSASVEPKGVAVRVELDGAITAPSWFALTAPDRLVLDLPGGETQGVTVGGDGLVRRLRLAQHDGDTARLVIELAAPARLTLADPQAGAVAVRLEPTSRADFANLARHGRYAATAPLAVVAAPPTAARPLVMIDPGHGGRDVGAISAFEGRQEKEVTLAIARAARDALNAGGIVTARLTRDDDRFLALGDRVAIARAARADLFISVHADSAPNPDARGATVYTLSEVASDRMAARMAARENRADAAAAAPGDDPQVATILFDLTKRGAMNTSARFAGGLQAAMSPDVRFTSNSHRFAGFRVLKTADIPAVLLETGYLSNLDDARALFSPARQRAIAEGVRRAVEAHFARRIAAR